MKYVLLLLLTFPLAACSAASSTCQIQSPGSNVYIHSYGDSITQGLGASTPCDAYQPLLAKALGVNGDNMGVSGSVFAEVQYDISMMNYNAADDITASNGSHPQDIATFLPGFNDVTEFGSDPDHLNLFAVELQTSLLHLTSLNKLVLVGTTMYMSEYSQTNFPEHTNANTDLYVNLEKQIVQNLQAQGVNNLYLVDVNSVYDPETMVSKDNIHPSDEGHEIIANAFLQVYQSTL